MCTVILSPGFMSNVSAFGVSVATSDSCGLGGPVGTPLVWIHAKLTGSSQLLLHCANWNVHSRLSIVSAAHQWLSSQLVESTNGGMPGG